MKLGSVSKRYESASKKKDSMKSYVDKVGKEPKTEYRSEAKDAASNLGLKKKINTLMDTFKKGKLEGEGGITQDIDEAMGIVKQKVYASSKKGK